MHLAASNSADHGGIMADVERVLFDSATVQIGVFRCPPGQRRFPGGQIDAHLVAFPWSSVVIEQDGRPPVVADPNVAMLYNPSQEYARYEVDRRGDHCAWYSMPGDVVGSALGNGSQRFEATHAAVSPVDYLHHRRIVNYVSTTPNPDRLLVEESAMSVLATIFGQVESIRDASARRPATLRRHEALVRDALRFMAGEFRNTLALATIAREVGSSAYHLARVFRSVTGRTVHRHLMQLRLRSALGDVMDSRMDLASIAVASGLSSHSHLSRLFQECFTASPSRIRAAISIEAELRKIVKA